jgi:hypothetical protein
MFTAQETRSARSPCQASPVPGHQSRHRSRQDPRRPTRPTHRPGQSLSHPAAAACHFPAVSHVPAPMRQSPAADRTTPGESTTRARWTSGTCGAGACARSTSAGAAAAEAVAGSIAGRPRGRKAAWARTPRSGRGSRSRGPRRRRHGLSDRRTSRLEKEMSLPRRPRMNGSRRATRPTHWRAPADALESGIYTMDVRSPRRKRR